MKYPSAVSDRHADAFLAAALRSDVEALLLILIEVVQTGRIRGLLDLLDALGASARALFTQLDPDRAEYLLRRRLLAAAIHDAEQRHHPREEKLNIMPTPTATKALNERREQLITQLATLRAHHTKIAADAQLAEQDWLSAVETGDDTALPSERRKGLQAELHDKVEAITHLGTRLAEVEQQLAAKVPHEAQDRQLAMHAADFEAFGQLPTLADLLEHAVETLVDQATTVHREVRERRETADSLNARAQGLRNRGAQLGRTETIPTADWHQDPNLQLRGTDLYPVWLTVIQGRPNHDVAVALANAAGVRLATRTRDAQRVPRNI